MEEHYHQMFSPQNNMSYLASPQGRQSCQQMNHELSERFQKLKVEYDRIAEHWPSCNGEFVVDAPTRVQMWW